MPLLNKLSGAFPAILMYITVGILIEIWTIAWYIFYPPVSPAGYFWMMGLLLSGFAIMIIGFFLGHIGRAARTAELPPKEVVNAVAQAEQNAAARAPIIAPVSPVSPIAPQIVSTASSTQTAPPAQPVEPITGVQPIAPAAPGASAPPQQSAGHS